MGVVGFHMNDDILNRQGAVFEFVGNGMGDPVAFPHGEVAIHQQLDIHPESESTFSYPAFVDPENFRLVQGDAADLFQGFGGNRGVHHLMEGFFEDADGIVSDERAGEEGGPGIGPGEGWTSVSGERNADEGGDGCDGIRALVQGVGFQRGAVDGKAYGFEPAVLNLFDGDDKHEQRQGPDFRGRSWFQDGPECVQGKQSREGNERKSDKEAGERFGFAMAKGVVPVRRTRGDFQAAPDDDRREEIEERFKSVGYEGERIAEDSAQDFTGGKQQVDAESGECGTGTGSFSAGVHPETVKAAGWKNESKAK